MIYYLKTNTKIILKKGTKWFFVYPTKLSYATSKFNNKELNNIKEKIMQVKYKQILYIQFA